MIRHCDGTDPNLTRNELRTHFNPETMTRSPWDNTALGTDYTVINCDCGLTFDDADRAVIYPHDELGEPIRITLCSRGGQPTQADLNTLRMFGEALARRRHT